MEIPWRRWLQTEGQTHDCEGLHKEHDTKDHGGTRDMHYQNKITRMVNERDRSAEHVKQMNDFAATFWEIKGIKSKATKYHCKPNLDIVWPEL